MTVNKIHPDLSNARFLPAIFGFVCLALALHLRPDANSWRQQRRPVKEQ
jgi:hypothetical protein